jgi:hypothetical protein
LSRTSENNLGDFLLLNPGLFFGVSGPAQKAMLVPFFWEGGFVFFVTFAVPPPPPFFFYLRGISVGAFSELKTPKKYSSQFD